MSSLTYEKPKSAKCSELKGAGGFYEILSKSKCVAHQIEPFKEHPVYKGMIRKNINDQSPSFIVKRFSTNMVHYKVPLSIRKFCSEWRLPPSRYSNFKTKSLIVVP